MIYDGVPVKITYVRDETTFEENIMPILSKDDNAYHIGLWVKDGAVGIGTISFYGTDNDKYAALGHGITDVDTGELINVNDGNIVQTDIVSIEKGTNISPGQIKGTINSDAVYGDVRLNNSTGIYGKYLEKNILEKYSQGIDVANINEIKTGDATIISTVDNQMKEYSVKIKKIYRAGNKDNKNMVIEITDEELLNKTGGIIQGMSGSPIIQSNRLVGILTHVFINDPTKGYAIFANTMTDVVNSME